MQEDPEQLARIYVMLRDEDTATHNALYRQQQRQLQTCVTAVLGCLAQAIAIQPTVQVCRLNVNYTHAQHYEHLL